NVVELELCLVEHLANDRGPALCVDFRGILLRKTHLGPNSFIDHFTRDRKMSSTRVNAHVIVKTAVSVEPTREKTRTLVISLKHKSARAVGKDRRGLLIVPIEILADRVRADNKHVAIRRVGDDELRRRVQRSHETC